jgi:sterol desaturase/sphingolipid hydroxylase (fatty acid hydroxylase superfamily)
MEHIFSKENISDWLAHYGMTIFIGAALSVILCSPERNGIIAIVGILIAYFWAYFAHRLIHVLPTEGPLKYLNTHWIFHHQPLKILDRRVELFFEFINDMCMSLSLLLIQYISGVWIVPTSVIVFHALWYSSVHIFNYSIIGSTIHRDHHAHVYKNFGPDVIDNLFGTNHDNIKEDILYLTPNAVLAFAATLLLKQAIQWKD